MPSLRRSRGVAVAALLLVAPGGSARAGAAELSEPPPSVDLLRDAPIEIDGATRSAALGASVAAADVNGDGEVDMVAGTTRNSAAVVFGGFPSILDLHRRGFPGFRIVGSSLDQRVARAGDVNGDGLDDLLLLSADNRTAYVVFGRTETTQVDVDALSAGGYTIALGAGAQRGVALAGAGDVNGDGRDDVLAGLVAGTAYVIFGKVDPEPQEAAHLATGGYPISFPVNDTDYGLPSVVSAGDVDGDGLDDILIASRAVDRAWVVFGKANTVAEFVDALGSAGYTLQMPFPDPKLVAANAGDANGDGVPDQILFHRWEGGWVVFGKRTSTTAVDMEHLRGGGYLISTADAGLFGGEQVVSIAGGVDVNHDGRDDQLIGIPTNDPPTRPTAGAVFVLYGKTTRKLVDVGVDWDGYEIVGPAPWAAAGTSIATKPPGLRGPPILLGAPGNDANGRSESGTVYGLMRTVTAHPAPLGDATVLHEPASAVDRPGRLTVRFTIRRRAQVDVRVLRVVQRRGDQCPPASRTGIGAVPCVVRTSVAHVVRLHRRRGRGAIALDIRLRPGEYRIVLTARDETGRSFGPYRATLTVAR